MPDLRARASTSWSRTTSAEGRLAFTTDVASGVAGAEVILLAVGTPPGPDGSADLSFIFKAAEQVADALTGWAVVVTKTTVPVGTGDKIEAIVRKRAKHEFAVASNPEFLKEGDAVNDFMKPDRVVVGAEDKRAIESAARALRAVHAHERSHPGDGPPLGRADQVRRQRHARDAHLVHERPRDLCELLGADIELVRKGIGSDVRIGPKFLFAGPGFGGSCFPKDLRARGQHRASEVGYDLAILDAVDAVNERQKRMLGEKVIAHFGGDLEGAHIAVWGLAFKPGTDDIREAPALVLIDQLLAAGATVAATDPVAHGGRPQAARRPHQVRGANYDCAKGADALVLVTEWHEFRRPSSSASSRCMRQPVLFDGRNVWSPPSCAPPASRTTASAAAKRRDSSA